jgi:predicted DNA-binding transcriptional regulator AlpA
MSNPRPKRYLTAAQLRERYGDRSTMWIERIMKRDPRFPRPIYIGRYRFWNLNEIEAYERDVAARRVPEVAP